MVCQLYAEIIPFYSRPTKKARSESEARNEKRWAGNGTTERCQLTIIIRRRDNSTRIRPWFEPFPEPPTRSASRLNSTQLESTWCGSTVTDESLSVLSLDWHTRGAYRRTKAGTVSPCHDFLSLKRNWWVNWIFMHVHRYVHKQPRPEILAKISFSFFIWLSDIVLINIKPRDLKIWKT